MSTSPDDLVSVSPPLMTTFVVPTVLARQVADFLGSLGMTVGKHPAVPDEGTFLAVPSPEIVAALADVTGRYRVEYDDTTFGRRPRVVDTEATVDLNAGAPVAWRLATQVPDVPAWVPVEITDPDRLSVWEWHYPEDQPGQPVATCLACGHASRVHHSYAYRAPLSAIAKSDVEVIMCSDPDCACRARWATPTPV